MKRMECEFEPEVLAAVLQSRWPDRADAKLREHVAECAICSDIATVAGAFDQAREEMRAEAVIPDSGRMWWIAQLRARREAAKTAGRPITAAQVIAFACATAVLGACFGATSTWFQSALGRVTSTIAGFKWGALLPSAASLVTQHGALALAVGALVVLVPTSVYLAVLRD